MRARLQDESGMALATAIIVLLIIIGLGLAGVELGDSQQRAAARERSHEAGFNQAEALLNAQVFQLARSWPTSTAPATAKCTDSAATGASCPDKNSIDAAFPATSPDFHRPPCNPAMPDVWRTYVQDDDTSAGGGGTQYYDPTVMNPANTGHTFYAYDQNNDGSVWVRAETTVKCRRQVVVGLATRAKTTIQWPTAVLAANWFKTGNNGRKVIVDTAGPGTTPAHDPADISLRCHNLTKPQCQQYQPGQVAPDTVPTSAAAASPVIGGSQLGSLRQEAQATNTYSSTCSLPAGLPSMGTITKGTVVFVESGPACAPLSLSGNTVNNPIILVIAQGSAQGSLNLTGNAAFYGLVYAANTNNVTNSLINLSGCAHIQGLVAVDGDGGVTVGSCKNNLVFDNSILPSLQTFGGVTVATNSFRALRGNTPAEP
jgi:Tfp pilus assembly protein PilX